MSALSVLLAPASYCASADADSKVAYINYIEERLKSLVTEITGTDKVVVVVTADEDVKKSRSGKADNTAQMRRQDADAGAEVLPGVPVKKQYVKDPEMVFAGNTVASRDSGSATVTKLSVSILVDKSVPEPRLKEAYEAVAVAIQYNPGRGDRIEMMPVEFRKRSASFASFFKPPQFYWFVLTLLAGAFLVTVSFFLMNIFRKVSSALTNINLTVSRGPGGAIQLGGKEYAIEQQGAAAGMPAPGAIGNEHGKLLAGPSVAQEGANGEPSPFSFIGQQNLRDLAFILGERPPEDTAVIVNYLNPELSAKLFENFPEEVQMEIALSLSELKEVSPGDISRLEEEIKDRLQHIVRGEDKAASLLSVASDDVRDKVIGMLERKDSGAADRMKQRVKSFETVMRELSSEAVQAVYRQIDDPTLFAKILKSSPEDIQNKVQETLSAGAAERLKQEMDLTAPMPAKRLREERYKLMQLIRKLDILPSGEAKN